MKIQLKFVSPNDEEFIKKHEKLVLESCQFLHLTLTQFFMKDEVILGPIWGSKKRVFFVDT